LQVANLAYAHLQGAELERTILIAHGIGTGYQRPPRGGETSSPYDPKVRAANLAGAKLTGAKLQGAQLQGAILEGAILESASRPAIPAWESQPNVMFGADDPLAQALGWGEPSMSGKEYDERLSDFLVGLACEEGAPPEVAAAVASLRFTPEFATRLLAAPCAAVANLPPNVRRRLEEFAQQFD
jgi:hypothetical protein